MSPFTSSPKTSPPTGNLSYDMLGDLLKDLGQIDFTGPSEPVKADVVAEAAVPKPDEFDRAVQPAKTEAAVTQPFSLGGFVVPQQPLVAYRAGLPASSVFTEAVPTAAAAATALPVSAGGRWGAEVVSTSPVQQPRTAGDFFHTPSAMSSSSSGSSRTPSSTVTLPETAATLSVGAAMAAEQRPQPKANPNPVINDQVIERPKGAPAVDLGKFRTKVCRNWAAGVTCQFGDRCAFAHGNLQIREPQAHNPCLEVYGPNKKKQPPAQPSPVAAAAAAMNAATMGLNLTPAAMMLDQSSRADAAKAATADPSDLFVDQSGCHWFGQ